MSKKKSFGILPLIIGAIIIYAAFPEIFEKFFDDNNSNTVNTSPVPAPVSSVKTKTQTSKPVGTWPYLSDNSQQTSLSPDLLRKNYYVVFDGSGSMSDIGCSGNRKKIDVAKTALTDFSGHVPSDANLGMMIFDNFGVSERSPLAVNNRSQFRSAVMQVYANRGTPLKSAITLAFNKLTLQAKSQLGYGEYNLVVVTDGEADAGENPRAIVNKIINDTPIVIHTIGFCINKKHSLNQAGKTIYKSATDVKSLRQSLQDVLAESPSFSAQQF